MLIILLEGLEFNLSWIKDVFSGFTCVFLRLSALCHYTMMSFQVYTVYMY